MEVYRFQGGTRDMSYAVVRMVKLKSHDLKGIQFHNQRERESKTNLDIDKSKSAFNYDLINSKNIDYNKQVKEIIESQKEGTRKNRKDAVLVNEFLVTSDKPFFDSLSPIREKEFFKVSAEFFKKRYGEQNIVFATVHIDEKTPHMHIGVVPMRDGKLQGKNVFNRKELLAIQEEFPKHMKEKGFDLERGELGSTAEHIEIQRLKAMTVREEVQRLEHTRETLKKDVEGLTRAIEVSTEVESIPVDKGGLFDRKNVRMATEDFERIKILAKASEVLKTNEKGLKNEIKDLQDRNLALKKQNQKLVKEKQEIVVAAANLEKENKRLHLEVNRYKAFNDYYQRVIEEMKRLAERYLKVDLEKMRQFVGQVRMATAEKVFGKEVINENVMDVFVQKDEQKGAKEYIDFYKQKQSLQVAEKSETYEQKVEPEREKPKRARDDFEMGR